MRTTRVLAIVAILGIALSFRASANVAYDSETTNTWFAVDVSEVTAAELQSSPWTYPSQGGEAAVEDSVIKLDTDLDDPLVYTKDTASGPVATVKARFTATANAAAPGFTGNNPQAALTVLTADNATNWIGLVKNNDVVSWETFQAPVPVVGSEYDVDIEFDNRDGQKKIRYRVNGAVLGSGWYDNPVSAASISSVSFAGTGDIGDFSGATIVENGATFNGTGYATFADALAAAKASGAWADGNPIVLYKDAAYEASATETLYVNPNGKTFTINGEVVTKKTGNTYTVTAWSACEAKINSTYYVTFDEAVAEAGSSDVIVVNTSLTKDLTVAKSYGLNPNDKLTCATLTVNAGQTLTLAGGLAVTAATINGEVAGETLTVNGTLTGVNVVKLTLGDGATFAYAGAKLAPTTLTMGTSLTITGLDTAEIGTEVITATGLDASKITATVKEGMCLEIVENTLTVVKEILATITASSEAEGYDYTNGMVSVTANVKDGKTATAVLTVIGWDGTTKKVVAPKQVTSGTALTWDVAEAMQGALTQGGAYTYTVEVMVDDKVAAVKSGEFTAAKWGADGAWFKADATSGVSVVVGGSWESIPDIADGKYAISDAKFNVMSEAGSNEFTRVDTAVSFESLVDDTPDAPDGDTVGGFVATTTGWKALGAAGSWVDLEGAALPAVGVDYVIRAEFDFPRKRVRFFVKTGADGDADFVALSQSGTDGEWVAWTTDQETLKAVEFQGSGALASIMATVTDKALFEVNGKKFDTMEAALAEAGTEGTNTITLLTNATIEPTQEGKYVISADGYQYVSGGKVSSGDKTIIVDEPGKPVVRPSDATMQDVKTPDGKPYKNYDNLRKFLEKSGAEGYTKDNADAQSISNALETVDAGNNLKYWQDYALGIEVGTSVAPVTKPAGDTDAENITLAIPAVTAATQSGDYVIKYQVTDGTGSFEQEGPGKILIPLNKGTGTYKIKVLFTPAAAAK